MLRPNWIEIGWAMNVSRNPPKKKCCFVAHCKLHMHKCALNFALSFRDDRIFFTLYDRLRATQIIINSTKCRYKRQSKTVHFDGTMVLHRANDRNHWLTYMSALCWARIARAHTHALSEIINRNRWRTKRFCMLFSSFQFSSILHSRVWLRASGKCQLHRVSVCVCASEPRKTNQIIVYIYLRRICISSAHFHILWMY